VARLLRERDETQTALEVLERTTLAEMWGGELDALDAAYTTALAARAALDVPAPAKAAREGAAAPKRRAAKKTA
jgi:hypothetical protein